MTITELKDDEHQKLREKNKILSDAVNSAVETLEELTEKYYEHKTNEEVYKFGMEELNKDCEKYLTTIEELEIKVEKLDEENARLREKKTQEKCKKNETLTGNVDKLINFKLGDYVAWREKKKIDVDSLKRDNVERASSRHRYRQKNKQTTKM